MSQSEARLHLIDTYRKVADQQAQLALEMYQRADDLEHKELGHECGHQFIISFHSIGHYGIHGEGPESHADTAVPEEEFPVREVTVRAHDLPTALRKASALPLIAWYPEEERLEEYSGDSKVDATFHTGRE
jgi:hypothetical protein